MRTRLLALALVACSPGERPDPPGAVVALGAVIDQTGSIARPAWRTSAELAVEHANEGLRLAGGFHDLVFVLRFSDSSNVPRVALERATALVRDRGAVGLVTDTTSDTVAIGATHYDTDAANDLGVPIVCMACASPELNDPLAADPSFVVQRTLRDADEWIYRTAADADPEATALLNAARDIGDANGDGTWKVAIYVIDDEFGRAFFQSIQRARDRNFPRLDPEGNLNRDGLQLEIVRHAPDVDANTYDWAGDLAQLVDARNEEPEVNPLMLRTGEPIPDSVIDGVPDVIMEVTFPLFAASITRAYLEAGPAVRAIPFLHQHNFRHDTTLVKLITLDIEGQEGVSHAVLANCASSGAVFRDALAQRSDRAVGLWDAQTYDAVMVLGLAVLVALQREGITDPRQVEGAQIREALDSVDDPSPDAVEVHAGPAGFAAAVAAVREGRAIDYVGASGPVDFDEHGNVLNDFVRYRLSGSQFVTQIVYGCVADPETCAPSDERCD